MPTTTSEAAAPDTSPETTEAMTPEMIELEQKRARYFDLYTTVNMLLKQGNAHGYFNRPDEVEKYNELRKEMEKAGTPIPAINQKRTMTVGVVFELDLTDELAELWGLVSDGMYTAVNHERFTEWSKENLGRDKAKLAKWLKDVSAKAKPIQGSDTAVSVKTELGEWPKPEIAEIGKAVMDEIKEAAAAARVNTNQEVF